MLIWIVWHFCRVYRYHCTRSVHLYLHLHLHCRNPGEWTNINIVCLLLLRLVLTCLRPPLFFLLDLVRLGTKATAGALNRAFEALFGSDVKHRCCTRFSAVVVSTMDHDILGPTLTEPQHCNLFRFTRSIRDIEFEAVLKICCLHIWIYRWFYSIHWHNIFYSVSLIAEWIELFFSFFVHMRIIAGIVVDN